MKCHILFSMMFCLLGTTLLFAEPEFTIPELIESASSQQLTDADRALIYEQAIAQHMNNEEAFKESIDALLKIYDEQNEPEKAIRLLWGVVGNRVDLKTNDNPSSTMIEEFLGPRMEKYQKNNSELVSEIIYEMFGFGSAHKGKSFLTLSYKETALADSILQRIDEAQREQGLQELTALLTPENGVENWKSGLRTLRIASSAKFDRAPFYGMVIPMMDSPDPEVRALAIRCLPKLDADESILPKLAMFADDKEAIVRKEVPGALTRIDQGNSPEIVIPVLMKLMKDENQEVRRKTTGSQMGAYSSPEYDQFLIEQASLRQDIFNILFLCLSPMKSKSPAVCQYLISVLSDPASGERGQAAWGLTFGVVDEAKPIVEAGVLKALPEETNANIRKHLFNVLKDVGTEQSRPYLESVVASDLETDEMKELASEVLEQL